MKYLDMIFHDTSFKVSMTQTVPSVAARRGCSRHCGGMRRGVGFASRAAHYAALLDITRGPPQEGPERNLVRSARGTTALTCTVNRA